MAFPRGIVTYEKADRYSSSRSNTSVQYKVRATPPSPEQRSMLHSLVHAEERQARHPKQVAFVAPLVEGAKRTTERHVAIDAPPE